PGGRRLERMTDPVAGRTTEQCGRYGGDAEPSVRPHDASAVQVAVQPLAQPVPGDTDTGRVGEAVRGRHAHHGPAGREHEVTDRRGARVDRSHDDGVVEGRPGVLV